MIKYAAKICALFLAIPQAAFAQDDLRATLLGVWGTPAQCARAPIISGGTRLRSPVEIGPDWFQQHGIWCRLTWFAPQKRANGFYVSTRAMCGEDSARGYWLAFDLDTSGETPNLSVIWDESLVNGPMQLCDHPSL